MRRQLRRRRRTHQFWENSWSWTSAININKLQSHFEGRQLISMLIVR